MNQMDASGRTGHPRNEGSIVGHATVMAEERSTADEVARLLPLHVVAEPGSGRGPGRPRKVERRPDEHDLIYHREKIEEQQRFVESDSLVVAAKRGTEPTEMLRMVRGRYLEIAATLESETVGRPKGKDTAQIRSRQVAALREAATIEMELRKHGAGGVVDLKGEKFQRIFKLWIGMIRDVTMEMLEPEQVELLFNRLETEFTGWEVKAEDVIR